MVLANVNESSVVGGEVVLDMTVDAFTEQDARRRFKVTARAKGYSNAEVRELELEQESGFGRQNTYSAEVASPR